MDVKGLSKDGLLTKEGIFALLGVLIGEKGISESVLTFEKYFFDGISSAVDSRFEDEGLSVVIKELNERLVKVEENTRDVKKLLTELIMFLDKDRKDGVKTILRKKKPVKKPCEPLAEEFTLKSCIIDLVEASPKGITVQAIQLSCIDAGFLEKYRGESISDVAAKLAFNKDVSGVLKTLQARATNAIIYERSKKLYFPIMEK